MKVFISVDMEGVAGIATLDQTVRGGSGYARAQELMTQETNAAIQGAFDAGATEVLVNDSHGTMDNLLHERLDRRARVVFGAPRAQCMAHGLPPDAQVALFVGYHAAAGAEGVLAHTFSASFRELRVNGVAASETDVNAFYVASLGVPVGLITGDEQICTASEKSLPGVVTVAVKRGQGYTAVDSVHPEVAREMIRAGAARAVELSGEISPLTLPDRYEVEIDLDRPTATDMLVFIPGVERIAENTIRFVTDSTEELLRFICAGYYLAALSTQQWGLLLRRQQS